VRGNIRIGVAAITDIFLTFTAIMLFITALFASIGFFVIVTAYVVTAILTVCAFTLRLTVTSLCGLFL
jgi:hypothetical protein